MNQKTYIVDDVLIKKICFKSDFSYLALGKTRKYECLKTSDIFYKSDFSYLASGKTQTLRSLKISRLFPKIRLLRIWPYHVIWRLFMSQSNCADVRDQKEQAEQTK